MTKSDGKHFGPGAKGKGAGVGAMTDSQDTLIEENMVLTNRDKAQHSDLRGQDGRWVQTEQMRDHVANKSDEDKPRR